VNAAGSGEDGFALIAALGAALLFALVAYTVLATDRAAIATLDAQQTQARLEAAADGGLALAVQGLGGSPGRRWRLDGRIRSFDVGGARVDVLVEDERGKVPLGDLSTARARSILETAGVRGARLDQLTASLINWTDGADRPGGATALDYAPYGLRPREAALQAVGELMAIKGMDRALFDRIAPSVTVFGDDATTFDPTTATPFARKVMAAAEIADQEESGDEPPVKKSGISMDADDDYVGRRLTVRITARDSRGGLYRRAAVIELTGQSREPYWIRAIE
jgi:general secretion pathway protein K